MRHRLPGSLPRRPAPRPLRIRWAALLALALLWAQCLGVWHHSLHATGSLPRQGAAALQVGGGVAHLGSAGGLRADAAAAAAQSAAGLPAAARAPGAFSVFHHAAGDIECRLLDQLLLADAAPAAQAPAMPGLPAATPQGACAGLLLPLAQLRAYQARAPPSA